MRKAVFGAAGLAFVMMASHAHAGPARVCGDDDSTDDLTSLYGDDIASHRMFDLQPIVFAQGDNASYQVNLILLVNADGTVKCVQLPVEDDTAAPPFLTHYPDDAILAAVGQWRYEPYHDGGQAIPFTVTETVVVTHVPTAPVPMPQAAPDATAVTLERSTCFGSCPAYKVTVHGDGRVDYTGTEYGGVNGDLHYTVAKSEADALFARLRQDNIWSAQDAYVGAQFDASNTLLTLDVGGQEKVIRDYLGEDAGIPETVTAAEGAIDTLVGTDRWTHITPDSLTDLDALHFDYAGDSGAALLINAIADDQSDDAVVSALLDRHVSLAGAADDSGTITLPLDAALAHGRSGVIPALIKAGALLKDGKPDPARIDGAFHAAIQNGDLDSARIFGPMHPAMTYPYAYTDYSTDPASDKTMDLSVLFLIDPDTDNAAGLYQYLLSLGADPKARDQDGATLLIKLGNNPEIAKSLIGLGVDVNARDNDGGTALLSVSNDDSALLLLQAGADPNVSNDFGDDIFSQADFYDWSQVKAWLKAHKVVRQSTPAS